MAFFFSYDKYVQMSLVLAAARMRQALYGARLIPCRGCARRT